MAKTESPPLADLSGHAMVFSRHPAVPLVCLAAIFFFAPFNRAHGDGEEEIRFVSYNLKNYLPMSRRVGGEYIENAPKPEEEIEALIQILASAKPDIIGLCEIGSKEDLADLNRRLQAAGLSLPYSTLTHGADPVRGLALMSRFPIEDSNHQSSLFYLIDEENIPFQRGVLDVTVAVSGSYRLRLLGLHLKSKRPVPEADQALMRRNEAHLLRKHVDSILAAHSEVNLLVYGDFNDSRNEAPIKAIQGRFGSPDYLRDIPLADNRGNRWTYYWGEADQYSRFDYIFVNEGLFPEINQENSLIASSPMWYTASDHRPLVVSVIPKDRVVPGN